MNSWALIGVIVGLIVCSSFRPGILDSQHVDSFWNIIQWSKICHQNNATYLNQKSICDRNDDLYRKSRPFFRSNLHKLPKTLSTRWHSTKKMKVIRKLVPFILIYYLYWITRNWFLLHNISEVHFIHRLNSKIV